jgi:hypothetical protein
MTAVRLAGSCVVPPPVGLATGNRACGDLGSADGGLLPLVWLGSLTSDGLVLRVNRTGGQSPPITRVAVNNGAGHYN